MDADHIMAAVDDETLLDFLANHPGPSNFGGPLTKERKGDKLMAYAKMYMIPHGSGHNGLIAGLEVVQTAAAAAIEARARRLFTGSFMCSIEQPSCFLHERDLTDFFKLCTVNSSCTRLESWPGCELRECAHEKRLLCWAWLRAGGTFSALPKDLVVKIAQYLRDPLISHATALQTVAYPGPLLTLCATVDPHVNGYDHRYHSYTATTFTKTYKAPAGGTCFTIKQMLKTIDRFLENGIERPYFMDYDMIPNYHGMCRKAASKNDLQRFKATFEIDLFMDPDLDGWGEEDEDEFEGEDSDEF